MARAKSASPSNSTVALGFETDFGTERADYVLTSQPFNDSDWFRKVDDVHRHNGENDSNSKRSWR